MVACARLFNIGAAPRRLEALSFDGFLRRDGFLECLGTVSLLWGTAAEEWPAEESGVAAFRGSLGREISVMLTATPFATVGCICCGRSEQEGSVVPASVLTRLLEASPVSVSRSHEEDCEA